MRFKFFLEIIYLGALICILLYIFQQNTQQKTDVYNNTAVKLLESKAAKKPEWSLTKAATQEKFNQQIYPYSRYNFLL